MFLVLLLFSCRYAVGVYDKQTSTLQLAKPAGGSVRSRLHRLLAQPAPPQQQLAGTWQMPVASPTRLIRPISRC
jgi:hypothetical protein